MYEKIGNTREIQIKLSKRTIYIIIRLKQLAYQLTASIDHDLVAVETLIHK